ncbi:hypothetical protein OFP48_27265, partial [Escherichia coli]|nr:hypothetical protein [Escherichia coli]
RHRSVRLVILVGLAIDQIAQSGLSSLSVIYYSAQLFSNTIVKLSKYCKRYEFAVQNGRENIAGLIETTTMLAGR